jgi:sigma-B regulation protein RsbU (phosphoserine phosphatase)
MNDPHAAQDQPFLDIRADDGASRRIPLLHSQALIGRSSESEVLLESTTVSRQHARLTRDPAGRWDIHDLGSRNGTLVNGQLVKERALRAGDRIQIGSFQLTLVIPSDTPRPTPPRASATGTSFYLSDEAGRLSTLRDLEPPRVAASHLTTLNQLSHELLLSPDPAERALRLCRLMVSPQFHGDWAVLLRVRRDPSADPSPEMLCEAQHAASTHGPQQSLHLSRSLLRAVARQGEAVLAGNASAHGSAADVEISIAPGAMAMAAIACPLNQADGELLDLLYVTLPPQYGTGEWLALASLAAKQYQQAEQTWAARTRDANHAALERELQGAREIQLRLVPKRDALAAFHDRGIDVAVGFCPSRFVGGDYVDALPMKDGRVLLALADVCGHGLAAALITSAVHTLIHAAVRRGADLLELADGLNQHLCETLARDSFVTFTALALNPADGTMQYVNAGHPPPVVIRADGGVRPLPAGLNLPLGLDPAPLESQAQQLDKGELLAIYSDGLNEQTNHAGAMLGVPALIEKIQSICTTSPNKTAVASAEELDQFLSDRRGNRPPNDDQSFLLARRT